MRSYVNPFRSRTSEQVTHQGLDRYLRTFGVDSLDLLPDNLWDRLVLIRSAPGAGKTSLLRAVSADTLHVLAARRHGFEDFTERLQAMGVLDDQGKPAMVGFRIPLARDFRGIVDLEPDPATARRTFVRLLDARIVAAFCDAIERLVEIDQGPVLSAVEVRPQASDAAAALDRLGGPNAGAMRTWAYNTEVEVLDRLDAVLPRDDQVDGHAALYSLRALSNITLVVDGQTSQLKPLLLLDDGHELAESQRTSLLTALHDRELQLPRWYTERYSAMEAEELVGDGEPRRNNEPVRLEHEALQMGSAPRRGSRTRRFHKLLGDIAALRASGPLQQYDDEGRRFMELLDVDDPAELDGRVVRAVSILSERLRATASAPGRYDRWFADADSLDGLDAARRWRELEILVTRDRDRTEMGLFELELTDEDRKNRSSSGVREAADLFLRREFGLPYYAGAERVSKLAAENIEQHLNICADLFDEMLVGITLRRGAVLPRLRQDAALTAASDRFWQDIPSRRLGGRSIQRLLRHIATMCRAETYRPKAPYPPGATGTALTMEDRARLLDPVVRARLPGAQPLYEALHGAIGHNLLRAIPDYKVKDNDYLVLYLNRLTCVRYGLPLGYGGFREKPLEEMCRWMLDDTDDVVEPSLQTSLDFA